MYTMGSKLTYVLSKACQASQYVSKNGTAYCNQLMEQNKHYVQEPATVAKCKELSKQLFYTRLASIPNRTVSFWKEVNYAKSLLKNRKELHVEHLWIAALLGLECFALFYACEIVGRGFTVRLLVGVSQSPLVTMSELATVLVN